MKFSVFMLAVIPLVLTGCGFFGGGQRQEEVSRGSLCGVPGIQGETVGRVKPEKRGCGIENAVRVTAVGGVSLSQGSVMECSTARVLNAWVQNDVDRIIGRTGGGLTELKVAAHYACRTRNKRGARVSEHGKGRAIDISAFNLADGSSISLSEDWRNGKRGRMLREIRDSACGPFATVLGPGSDGYHEDHFHFDTAQRDNNYLYCR